MNKRYICILCPNGCEMEVQFEKSEILSVSGNKCPKGKEYAEQEIRNPLRSLTSSVLVEGGEMPLCSVRLTAPVPKGRIFDVMEEIRKYRVTAPVKAGQVLIPNVLGLGSHVIATRNVKKEKNGFS